MDVLAVTFLILHIMIRGLEKKKKKQNNTQDKSEEKEQIKYYADEDDFGDSSKEKRKRYYDYRFDSRKDKTKLGTLKQAKKFRLAARAIVTLEMLIKDANSDIAVRRKSRKDFVAVLKLCEKVLFPSYCHIAFEEDLFEDYQTVESLLKKFELV